MMNRTKSSRLVPIALLAALMLAGCKETASETAEDVAKARADASEDVGAARQEASQTVQKADEQIADAQQEYANTDATARADLIEVQSDAMSKTAQADFDVAIANAKGIADVATEGCGMLTGVDKTACLSAAESEFEVSKAKATAERDAALVAAADKQQ